MNDTRFYEEWATELDREHFNKKCGQAVREELRRELQTIADKWGISLEHLLTDWVPTLQAKPPTPERVLSEDKDENEGEENPWDPWDGEEDYEQEMLANCIMSERM